MDSKPRKPKLPRKIPWQGWAMDPLSLPEVKMDAAKRAKPKVTRKVEWRSQDGKTVVVTGPFPRGFFRTDTRSSVAKAAKLGAPDMWGHDATSADDQYAKCLAEDVVEILGENEFGTVTP